MSVGSTQPFQCAGTVAVSASTVAVVATMIGSGGSVLVTNAASGTAFIRFGADASVVASGVDMPLPGGSRTLLHAGRLAVTASVVLASGSGTVFVSRGEGTVY